MEMKIIILSPIIAAFFAAACLCFGDNRKMFVRVFKLLNTLADIGLLKAENQVKKIK